MTKTHPSARRHAPGAAAGVFLTIALALAAGAAEAGEWILRIEPTFMDAYGHDQHVLTIHEIDGGSTPQTDVKTPVNLDTEAGPAYRFELRRKWTKWSLGTDFFWFNASQGRESRAGAAGAGEVVFEVADRRYSSFGPGDSLFFGVLEDTDLVAWTADLYLMRAVAETPDSGVHLRFGLRVADFDNDYRAVVGIRGVTGTQLDAESNYGLMYGPLVGLGGDVRRGKNRFEGYLGQSVVLGTAELASMASDFNGTAEMPSFFRHELFSKDQDVAIPITELRLKWTYDLTRHVSLGVGANSSVWWDVPVPPGVIPGAGGARFHENTIVFLGWSGTVGIAF